MPLPLTAPPATATAAAALAATDAAAPANYAPVLFLPGDRFFVRTVALAEGAPVDEQVALAIEGLSPFGPAQLYSGYVVAPDKKTALAYAAWRRRFADADPEAWDAARQVLPEFLPLLAHRPERGAAGIVLCQGPERLVGMAWRRGETLPAAVLVKESTSETDQEPHAAALRERAGLDADVPVRIPAGEINATTTGEGALELRVGHAATPPPWVLPAAALDAADVRDPGFLAARERAARRDHWLWRGVQLAISLLVFAALVEIAASVFRAHTASRNKRSNAQSADVNRLMTAQTLAERIGELSDRRLMPLEMLALINPQRPRSITFQRTVTRGTRELEIEAQTASAADVNAYESILKELPAIERVQTRDIRAREGTTSFILALTFRPEALRATDGPPVVPPGAVKPADTLGKDEGDDTKAAAARTAPAAAPEETAQESAEEPAASRVTPATPPTIVGLTPAAPAAPVPAKTPAPPPATRENDEGAPPPPPPPPPDAP
ncbi:MAG: hypothetical protein LBK99_17360 [Opitutaceae bacterium]|jgi:hypothetical protein|nr:hypothetical protein [Opitutaceae bacterium]